MQEQHSYPIFTESWGADEELLLIEGLTLYGLGNWQDAAEHVGTRTREECEQHYLEVWIGESKADSGVAAVSGGILRVAWWNQRRGGGGVYDASMYEEDASPSVHARLDADI